MSNGELFDWALARNLAYRIRNRMGRFATLVEKKDINHIILEGQIELADDYFRTKKQARCSFYVSTNWVEKIPTVICHEPWIIRKPPEWHVFQDGSLCFEFGLNWNHTLSRMVDKYTHGLTSEYAANWLLKSTRSLFNRHLFATRAGIKTWDSNWNYWPHGKSAAESELAKMEDAANYS